jgi:hypothetical protein
MGPAEKEKEKKKLFFELHNMFFSKKIHFDPSYFQTS